MQIALLQIVSYGSSYYDTTAEWENNKIMHMYVRKQLTGTFKCHTKMNFLPFCLALFNFKMINQWPNAGISE